MNKNGYMNDSKFSKVSGGALGGSTGLSTTKKVIIGVAATVSALAAFYGIKGAYNKFYRGKDWKDALNPFKGDYYKLGKGS